MHGDLSAIAKHLIAMLNQSAYLTTADIIEALPHADHDAIGIEMDMLMRAGVVNRGFVRHSEPLDIAYWLEHSPRPAGVVGPGVVTSNDFVSALEANNG